MSHVSVVARVLRGVSAGADRQVDRAFSPLRRPVLLRWSNLVSHLGDGGGVWVLWYLWQFRSERRKVASALAVLVVLSAVVNGPLKAATRRPRPTPLDGVRHRPPGSSFPSGHAFSSWLMAAMLPSGGSRRLAAALATPISLSRIHLRYHHGSDVVVGTVLGAIAGVLLRRTVALHPGR